MVRYEKQLYPAKVQPLASSSGYPKSGFFAMHITYPDTEYNDDVTDWTYGANSSGWKQGLTVIVRTPLATAAAPSEADNVIVVDLKTIGAAHSGYTYNLGTEEATRYIAAKINSRRVKQVGDHSETRYLKARYVRMSGKPTYSGTAKWASSANLLTVDFAGAFGKGFPSDLPTTGTLTYTDGDHSSGITLNYTNVSGVVYGPKRIINIATGQTSRAIFTITENMSSDITQVGTDFTNPDVLSGATFTITGEPEKHTIVLGWEETTPNTAGGYWAGANAGPIIQGLGQSVPTWLLAAKPMDGGNMGLPATNYDSRGSTAVAHTSGHGYVRFSIEGLNSCDLPEIPPPDFTVTSPSFRGITKAQEDTTGSSNVKLASLEYGTKVPMTSGDVLHLKNGYKATTGTTSNMVKHSLDEISSISYVGDFVAQGVKYDNDKYVPRPIFSAKSLNSTNKVKGLQIPNEHMVFEDLLTKDDQGNVLTISGGSPWGVVIKDMKTKNVREDPITGEEITGPSTTDGKLTPNLEIQLPDPQDIPGEIFVRSGHDRVQAYSNMTWGLGGLSAPDPRTPGIAEAANKASQFDTHDRTLVFHCQRLLHPDLATKQGLVPHTTAGAVPSGTTRLYTAHRITDHAERGSVLTQAANGVQSGYPYPHHRIRFGRQGHSFVSPLMHRGTPMALRKQLHRSHGSSYSLLFEAESEHKHHGFGSGKAGQTNQIYELDTLDTKGQTNYDYSTGSFSADGMPLDEIKGYRLPDVKTTYSSIVPRDKIDYLIAPGQEHTEKMGVGHVVRRAVPSRDTALTVAGPTKLTFDNTLPSADYNVANEFVINGFILGDYLLAGGKPIPPIIYAGSSNYFVSGREEGVAVGRIGTELATVPPLICHDPEYLNLAARTSAGGGITATNADRGLLKAADTGTGATPDAFLCNWLAEYSHPAVFGTSREHFMTFRYREAGMPRALQYPPVRGLYLRNFSHHPTAAQAENADPIERLYVTQWLQNYGYNGLNAGGHGATLGLRSANSVLMGHTTIREPQGTLRLQTIYDNVRHSRGEGIGDGVNPERTAGTISYDVDADGVSYSKYVSVIDSMVAYDMSRRLPIRAWGIRTASDALDMLAGDPNESTSNNQPIYGKGRFDGGVHDSVQVLPNQTDHGASWFFDKDYNGVERSTPIGLIMSGHTSEATPFSNNVRRSNLPLSKSETPIGIGATLKLESGGMTLPTTFPAGLWDTDYLEAPLKAQPQNKGSDPLIDLYQYTGSASYNQSQSNAAVTTTANNAATNFGNSSAAFFHLKGNALHTNASAIDHSAMRILAASGGEKQTHYPTTGWGSAKYNSSNNATTELKPIPLSEIAEHRQVQSRTEPRLGLIIDTQNEILENKSVEYQVIGTKAASLHSDLIVGQHYPVAPSWVNKAQLSKSGYTLDGGAGSNTTFANEYTQPTWSPDSDDAKGSGGVAVASLAISAAGTGYSDGNLTATGGGGSGFAGTYLVGRTITGFTLNSLRMSNAETTTYRVRINSNAVGGITATQAIIALTVNGQLTVTGISITSAGANFLAAHTLSLTYEVQDLGGNYVETSPSNGSGVAVVGTTGPVISLTMTNGGLGFTSNPTIVLSNAGSSAVIAPTLATIDYVPLVYAKTHALDSWTVRGSADLPAWGGVYILRKSYLNREKDGVMSTEVHGTSGNAMSSHPRRKAVDYIVRPVRPLKLFGFASDLLQDGWLNGARCKTTNTEKLAHQPFTRDGRYGVFEANVSKGLGNNRFVSTAEGTLSIDWPDANEYDAAYHLIPSSSMLQFFKSDAARKTIDGGFNPEIEPRYSQTPHPGGGEKLHQTQVRYYVDGTGIGGDFAKQGLEDQATHTTLDSMMRTYPTFLVKSQYTISSNNYIVIDDASLLPNSGTLFVVSKGKLTYSAKSGNRLTLSANNTGITDLTGQTLHYTTESSPTSLSDRRALTLPYVTIPTLADNALVLGKIETDTWKRYDATLSVVKQTSLSYRGLLEYDPSDFIMVSQRIFNISNGKNISAITNQNKGIQKIRVDGRELSETFSPPYLFDSQGVRLRIADITTEENTTSLRFKNIKGDSLGDNGIDLESGVVLGQYGFVGVRTSDAALMLLDDAGSELAGYNVTPTSALTANDKEVSSSLNAHPSLRLINDHSNTFVARKTKGINIMEAIRNLSQLDGRQLVNERNGGLIYSRATFNNKGSTINVSNPVRAVGVSKMIDSPNEVIVAGDTLANNERVYVAIKDPERMRDEAGRGATTGLAKTLRQEIPGLKTKQEAMKLAKAILARTENKSPVIELKGVMSSTNIAPGEIINLNLPIHEVRGEYAVFEAEHDYTNLESNFVIGQYDKGIEGLLSDLQAFTSNTAPADDSASETIDLIELAISGSVKIKAVHRISIRSTNNRGFLIGAKHTNGMGKVGVRDGGKRALPMGESKSIYYVVK